MSQTPEVSADATLLRRLTEAGIAIDRTWLQEWLPLIRGEYEELPDVQLTQSQVEERWELDPGVAAALLEALVSLGILTTRQGVYVRAHSDGAENHEDGT